MPPHQKLKKIIQNYSKKFSGEIEYFELYKKDNKKLELIFKLDSNGNIIQNSKLIKSVANFFKNRAYYGRKKYFKEDLNCVLKHEEEYIRLFNIVENAVKKYDPFEIAHVDKNEYQEEIRDITKRLIGKQLTKKQIFFRLKVCLIDGFMR